MRRWRPIAIVVILAAGCGGTEGGERDRARPAFDYPAAPAAGRGQVAAAATAAYRASIRAVASGRLGAADLAPIARTRDVRLGWLLSDLMRFAPTGAEQDALVDAFTTLTGVDPRPDPGFRSSPWRSITNHMIAWDPPAPPGYRELKGELFTLLEPGWRPFFADARSEIDWRLVSWGGVLIDDRPLGDGRPCPRGCIPALDDPELTPASRGDWYPDGATVFGVVVGGDAVALPKNIMDVHEMVNMTLGGRRLGIPYCTLCASAQAYFTDRAPGGRPLVLRTSGLLSLSNKVMFELGTRSLLDTFTGRARSGPLHRRRVVLPQVTVVTSTWGAWKHAHPDTRIVARDGGIGRSYEADPLGGRDDSGPIFPIGEVDPRLPVQHQVVGVIGPGGPVAFPVDEARAALAKGREVSAAGVELVTDGDGLRARRVGGPELPAHQAFWFAWSQFNPGTAVWEAPGG